MCTVLWQSSAMEASKLSASGGGKSCIWQRKSCISQVESKLIYKLILIGLDHHRSRWLVVLRGLHSKLVHCLHACIGINTCIIKHRCC
jgi:hypothetical protein